MEFVTIQPVENDITKPEPYPFLVERDGKVKH